VPTQTRTRSSTTTDQATVDAGATWWREATVHNQPYLLPDPARQPSRPMDFVYRPQPDVTTDVRAIQHHLEAIGLEVLVLDQTRPDIDLPCGEGDRAGPAALLGAVRTRPAIQISLRAFTCGVNC
jgi:hypothetical protein